MPYIAMMVAECFEKIRINPGNFADGRKTFDVINYDDPKQFAEERAYIEEVFTPLVLKCKELGRCIRIGTNHGSLSARILSYYGDTPRWVCCLSQIRKEGGGTELRLRLGPSCLPGGCLHRPSPPKQKTLKVW